VRYAREDRDSLEALARVLVPTPGGASLPLAQLADIVFVPGPQVIHSENTFLTSTVLFDRMASVSEGAAVEEAQAHLARAIANGELRVPDGVSYRFAGTHENQIRSEKRLLLLVPIALGVVFVLLVLQFKRVRTAAILASGVAVALSGGFLVLWLYGQPWFLNVSLGGVSLQDRFHVGAVPLSVATWVGLIALIGLATDDGVVMVTYLRQSFRRSPPDSVAAVRMRTVEAGVRRIRACLMTTATTLLALLPVVGSSGRGADVMVSLALPVLGGMTVALVTLFVVPVLWCACEERSLSDGS
jgi:Cu(I)/Ag(I) efflux system membrane protein CusA/SilA